MAAFIQEGKMPVDKDWFTMTVSRGTISSEHSNNNEVTMTGISIACCRRVCVCVFVSVCVFVCVRALTCVCLCVPERMCVCVDVHLSVAARARPRVYYCVLCCVYYPRLNQP